MEMMNKAGMSPMKVIVASTGDAAKIMGLKQVGTCSRATGPTSWSCGESDRQHPEILGRLTRSWIAGGKLSDVTPAAATR